MPPSKQKRIGSKFMNKITLNTSKLTNFLKKYSFLIIIGLFSLILIFDMVFIYLQIRNNEIDPSRVISREQKIDQAAYDKVLERDKNKITTRENIDSLNNPF